jgi:hypothetical protein
MIAKLAKHGICVLAVLVSGCAGTAQFLRSQPTTYYAQPSSKIELTDADLSQLFKVQCMRAQPADPFVAADKQSPQCLYVAVDASQIKTDSNVSRSVRDKAIAYLLGVSDSNCSNFLDRAFANKAGLDISKSLASDMATGVSALTAFNTPAISAGLGLTNLVVGKTVDNVNATFYFDKTFQAFEAAVITERTRIKSDIINRQASRPVSSTDGSAVQYGLFEAMTDIRTYDDACSMRVGLSKLVETASAQKKAQTDQSSLADNKATAASLGAAQAAVPATVPTGAASGSAPGSAGGAK